MEAAATPFPREETTPPVTKIYFGPLCKALESLRWSRRTTDYGEKEGVCQIRILERLEKFFRVGAFEQARRAWGGLSGFAHR